jgi:hypothetical protein
MSPREKTEAERNLEDSGTPFYKLVLTGGKSQTAKQRFIMLLVVWCRSLECSRGAISFM